MYLIYFRCRLQTEYNLNYTPATLGYKDEGKLHLAVREQKRLNTTESVYLRAGRPGSIRGTGKIFLFSTPSGPDLGPFPWRCRETYHSTFI
jgi:hypothetical protein